MGKNTFGKVFMVYSLLLIYAIHPGYTVDYSLVPRSDEYG